VIVLDQLSKSAIERQLALYDYRVILPVFNLTRAHNSGAAFSFLDQASGWQRWLFTALAVIVSGALVLWLKRMPRAARLLGASVALILAGALGNVIDRLRLGYVIDFIQVHWQRHYFPAFNVADSAITVGAALLILDAWLDSRHKEA
jgi:signal peptidase II